MKKQRNLEQKRAKKQQKKNEQRRKRYLILSVAAACVLMIGIVMLIASLPIRFVYEGDAMKNESTGELYYLAPWNYEPAFYTSKTYGRLDGHKVVTLNGDGKDKEPIDPKQWLARDVYGIYEVYYGEGVTLPTLENFEVNAINICNDSADANTFIAAITKSSEIQTVLRSILEGTPVEVPDDGEALANYTLRFSSSRYDWLYYKITFHVNSKGIYYYDRETRTTYVADALIEDYIKEAIENLTPTTESNSDTESVGTV
ncbi:MAG: hypothetical protein E7618_05650 [Ruminococcaceae bacterium]|nr:hypothetical protein [Oscillospiraceae bacterium]